ncbi:MAG: saccharopine dehydrogenase NADP-binding domain-containing protein [Pseudomonadota bacterium]
MRSYDLVLFGATGFTGGLTAEYLARHAPANTRWALAGRSKSKLEQVRTQLTAINPACANLPLLLADVSEPDSLKQVAESTKVAITTVGPYIHYGEPLVAACAAAGTHYVDLTGEPEFVDLMWLRHHETAQKSGAKIVHCCGFDSIPHDLGAYFTVQQLPKDTPITLEGFVRAGGGFSGGTFHSAVNAFSRVRLYARTRKERSEREGRSARKVGDTGNGIRFHKPLGSWVVPMPTIDPQIIKRSARALDLYGPEFRYGHFVQIKSLPQVIGLIGGVGTLFALAQLKPTRNWLLSKKNPGEGPSEAQRKKSWFRVRFYGEAGGKKVVTEVTGGDPGYGETSKMLAESGLCLAFDALPAGGGQMTPAQAMAAPLMARLMKAGIKFEVVEKA